MNVKTIRSQFENQQLSDENHQKLFRRCTTSLEPLNSTRHSLTRRTKPVNINVLRSNFQRSKTSLDLLSTHGTSDKKSLLDSSNISTSTTDDSENENTPLKTSTGTDSQRSRLFLNRQLSDPSKKGNIKRTPAFRCEKPSIQETSHGHMKVNITSKIRMYEQCQSKTKEALSSTPITSKPSAVQLHRITTPIAFKKDANRNIKITNLKSPSEIESTISNLNNNISDLSVIKERVNSSSGRSSSSSPTLVPIQITPQYSQVVKSTKKSFKTFSDLNPHQKSPTKKRDETHSRRLSDELSIEMRNTLKQALNSPLPDGPPPKKPPRTFAHGRVIQKPKNGSPDRPQLNKSPASQNIHRKPTKSRTDPKVMLAKLENALLNNKLKSPKARHRALEVENIKLAENPTPNKKLTSTSQNLDYRSNAKINNVTNPKNPLFNDCFRICASNEYVTANLSKSEFFVDANILQKSPGKDAEHIYAEPFEFLHNVPVNTNLKPYVHDDRTKSNCLDMHDGQSCPRISNPNRDIHYLCAPIQVDTSHSHSRKESHDKEDLSENLNVDKTKEDNKFLDAKCSKNKFHLNESPSFNSSTDSDFESLISTPVSDDNTHPFEKDMPLHYVHPHTDHKSFNRVLTANNRTKISDMTENEAKRMEQKIMKYTSLGRVRALIAKLETEDHL